MTEELEFTQKRLLELSDRALRQGRCCFSGFLNEAEAALSAALARGGRVRELTLYGGYENAVRQMARFGSADPDDSSAAFPLACVRIEPLSEKFAEPLTHRDYMGALLSLGIRRELLGDLLLQEKRAFLVCEDSAAPYLCDNLTEVRHTSVRACLCELSELPKPKRESFTLPLASPRLDAVVAGVARLSRTRAQEAIRQGLVQVRGLICEDVDTPLREGDTFSVRRVGKFRYIGIDGVSRKGRPYLRFERFL